MAARPLLMPQAAITTWHSSASRSRPKIASFWEGQAWGGQVQMKYGKGVFAGAVTAVLGVRAATAQITDTVGPDPDVYGGDILNETGMAVAVDGGTAIADATGGNNNLAFVS